MKDDRKVNLTKRIMVNGGLRYCPVVESSRNGSVRQDAVWVDGKEVIHREGTYYIDYREGQARVRQAVGKNAADDAHASRLAKQTELNAVKHGLALVDAPVMIDGKAKHSLAAAMASYLEDTKLTKKPKTLVAYSTALNYFAESCRKQFLEDIVRTDRLKFHAFLRDDKDQSPRSCWNKFANVMAFLKAQGIRGQVKKNDWPRFTEEEPEIYDGKKSRGF